MLTDADECCCYADDVTTYYYEIDGINDDDDDDDDDDYDDVEEINRCVVKKPTKVTFSRSPIKVWHSQTDQWVRSTSAKTKGLD